MRKITTLLTVLCAFCLSLSANAQVGDTPHALAARVLFLDYATPQGQSFSDLPISNGLEIAYIRNVNSFLNIAFPLHVGLANVPDYMNKRTVLGGDALLMVQYYQEGSPFTPYFLVGGGLASENFEGLAVEFPVGIGFNFKVGKDSHINLEGAYRLAQAKQRNHLKLGIGYWFTLKAAPKLSDADGDGLPDVQDECPEVAGPAELLGCPDTDGDGLVDKLDQCPNFPGPGETMGCPDGDGDGIADEFDKCPDEAGVATNDGCPEQVDADGDGVPDKEDLCPNEIGLVNLNGCPDRDGDGLADKDDACPDETGPLSNDGCPEMKGSGDRDGDGLIDSVDKCPDEAGPINLHGCPPKDRDGDGVLDGMDECPDAFGPVNLNGCPDSDGDGVIDKDDGCPDEAGPLSLNGCPPKDKDGDGVLDPADDCPDIPGLVHFNGCPDSDGDGIKDSEDACPQAAGSTATHGCPDSDGDGIKDSEDDCPHLAGLVALNGCPDSDGDGIKDSEDKCPNKAGKLENKGCPDSDGDGITDDKDPCPEKAGRYNGCPDSDGDGIDDAHDHCPNSAGPPTTFGCPELKEEEKETLDLAAQAIQFETGKATLKVESYGILNKVVGIMKKYPDYKLRIVGHTDNVGDAAQNKKLSEERARSCYDYLIAQGIDSSRLTYLGMGETQPIASNETEQGRELNRRVEFELYTQH